MKKKYNKFLIVSTVFLLIGGVYLYSSRDLSSGNIVPVAFGSSLTSSAVAAESLDSTTGSTPTPAITDGVNADIAFLATLVSLKDIKMDTSIFNSQAFKSLKNNSVKIDKVTPGRLNPFAPMSSTDVVNVASAPVVVTDQPTQITDKTAVLNGTVNSMGNITDTYFEYNTLNTGVNNISTTAKMSLVGTFVKNIIGLTSKTTYYFKACAKINNIANCGELISFTTN